VKKWLKISDSEIYREGKHALAPRLCKTVERVGAYAESNILFLEGVLIHCPKSKVLK
jgi:hypothetical protein